MAQRALRLVIMGAPGAGKGTQCTWLLRDFPSIAQVSTGAALRAHMRNGTDVGRRAAALVQAGQLVGDDVVNDIIRCEVAEADRANRHLLLDGFPRTVAQARALDDMTRVAAVVNLDVPSSVIMDRILNRWVHAPSGRTYHSTYSPPKVAGMDDVTGEPLVQRSDDTREVVEARLKAYDAATRPLIDHYRAQGKLHSFHGNTSHEIYPALKSLIADLLAGKVKH
ncbi:Adenylate kinase 2 [Blastocladiella emersonii ATCC 22665]|nr:Adenylate kinase 2 [Blastocladiella emersonii ATCC 22665]